MQLHSSVCFLFAFDVCSLMERLDLRRVFHYFVLFKHTHTHKNTKFSCKARVLNRKLFHGASFLHHDQQFWSILTLINDRNFSVQTLSATSLSWIPVWISYSVRDISLHCPTYNTDVKCEVLWNLFLLIHFLIQYRICRIQL